MKILTHNLGLPRIGPKRELKKALESYWAGKSTEADLLATAKAIRRQNWELQSLVGIDLIPSNDFSLYDHVLDTCTLVGAVPERFHWPGGNVGLSTYFAMARGSTKLQDACNHGAGHKAGAAMEMTKWFDSNYHYLVPELSSGQGFQLASTKPFDEWSEAKALGIQTVPVLLGPVSFLLLGKPAVDQKSDFDPLSLLPSLLSVYETTLQRLATLGVEWVQFDEPTLSLDLNREQLGAFRTAYARLRQAGPSLKLMLATYFGELRENLETPLELPVDAIHVDAARAPQELERVVAGLPNSMVLSAGIVDGRNIWRNDMDKSKRIAASAETLGKTGRLMVSPSCSLLHVPVSLKSETKLDAETKSWLAFAEEKLQEVVQLSKILAGESEPVDFAENQACATSRRQSPRIHKPEVKQRSQGVTRADATRSSPFPDRRRKQEAKLKLPVLPTTTIGSFPQTEPVRAARFRWKRGESSEAEYEGFLEQEIKECVRFQEEIGLDVLVHGEFERNDMVEYFGEQLGGFAFTENGWVQSYGSRCVKPPIIYGDVDRKHPMTLRWSKYAQSLTKKPMKGMLTGPITILQWSFARDDQPRRETARQIALAIRDEVLDLEAAGISVIQIDEPALREGLPLRRADWRDYLDWAGEAFRLSAAGVKDETQIHTHMCYCEFNDIIADIAGLDADVISIETSRSRMELLNAFVDFRYPNEIGPGVWDIHSPRVPSTEEMAALLKKAVAVIPKQRLWVNPDCGLKTRQWPEVLPALKNLVSAAKQAREQTNSK